jgi:hypothetical protein
MHLSSIRPPVAFRVAAIVAPALWWLVSSSAPLSASSAPIAPPVLQGGSRLEIASPLPNSEVRGTIQIIGTAIDTSFRYYELHWAPDPPVGDLWTPVQDPVSQQVQDGVLGIWDTTVVPDGLYLIRLRLVRNDDLTLKVEIRVQVSNATPTPRPTQTPLPSPTPLPGTATPGPSPTPLIWQPPTRTPRPTAGPGTPTSTPVGPDPAESPFRPERLREAMCNGMWIAVGVFVALGIYGSLRSAMRRPFRIWWWRFTNWLRDRLER